MAPMVRGQGVCIMPNDMNSVPRMEGKTDFCKVSSNLDTHTMT